MGKLHEHLQKELGVPVIVLLGNDATGIVAVDSKNNKYAVSANKQITKL